METVIYYILLAFMIGWAISFIAWGVNIIGAALLICSQVMHSWNR